MGAELVHATDGQTDMTRLIVAFCEFSKASRDALINYSRLNFRQGPTTFNVKVAFL